MGGRRPLVLSALGACLPLCRSYTAVSYTHLIAEIAVSVGFFDQVYFSRVFKKSKGVPPSKYRTSINQEKAAR